MDTDKINAVLAKAIVGMQEREMKGLALEALKDWYVPSEEEILDAVKATQSSSRRGTHSGKVVDYIEKKTGKRALGRAVHKQMYQMINVRNGKPADLTHDRQHFKLRKRPKNTGVSFIKSGHYTYDVSLDGSEIGVLERVDLTKITGLVGQKKEYGWFWNSDLDELVNKKNFDTFAKAKAWIKAKAKKL